MHTQPQHHQIRAYQARAHVPTPDFPNKDNVPINPEHRRPEQSCDDRPIYLREDRQNRTHVNAYEVPPADHTIPHHARARVAAVSNPHDRDIYRDHRATNRDHLMDLEYNAPRPETKMYEEEGARREVIYKAPQPPPPVKEIIFSKRSQATYPASASMYDGSASQYQATSSVYSGSAYNNTNTPSREYSAYIEHQQQWATTVQREQHHFQEQYQHAAGTVPGHGYSGHPPVHPDDLYNPYKQRSMQQSADSVPTSPRGMMWDPTPRLPADMTHSMAARPSFQANEQFSSYVQPAPPPRQPPPRQPPPPPYSPNSPPPYSPNSPPPYSPNSPPPYSPNSPPPLP
jgi:hypothetical protein